MEHSKKLYLLIPQNSICEQLHECFISNSLVNAKASRAEKSNTIKQVQNGSEITTLYAAIYAAQAQATAVAEVALKVILLRHMRQSKIPFYTVIAKQEDLRVIYL